MPQSTTLSVPRRSVRARTIAGILAIALGMVCTVACDSWSPLQRSSSDAATAISTWQPLLTLIEECERTAGRDVQRLEDCIPGPSPDLTPLVLTLLDSRRFFSSNGESASPGIDVFLGEVASEAEDPMLRAAARYYVAAGLMHAANALQVEPEDRDARPTDALDTALRRAYAAQRAAARERALGAATPSPSRLDAGTSETDAARQGALAAATGLSSGVEEAEFRGYLTGDTGDPRVPAFPTFAVAEADLIRSIRHGTVGSTLPEVTGKRLDGVEESLSDYRGRVVLLDFWATWCRPCVTELPDLRELVAELPADRFALIAISVDDEIETVSRFMENQPMPWTNWHVGRWSDTGRLLHVQGCPTYVLVDEHGRILARPRSGLPSLVRKAVARLSPPA